MSVETFKYDNRIVRAFAIVTVIWGIVGMLVGMMAAVELFFPGANLNLQFITFGRIRPLHTNAVIFAFVGNGMFMGIYYSLQRLCKARMFSDFLSWFNFWGWQLIIVAAAVTLPLTLPPTVLGYYLLVAIGQHSPVGQAYQWLFRSPLVFTWQAAVLASTLHAIPLLVRTARAALLSVDHNLERAARNLGASEWRLFWRITLPLTRRSIIAATVLAFARSLGDFGTTLMIAGDIPGRTQTASIAIYDAVESGDTMTARVLVLVISALTIVIVWLANRLENSVHG